MINLNLAIMSNHNHIKIDKVLPNPKLGTLICISALFLCKEVYPQQTMQSNANKGYEFY